VLSLNGDDCIHALEPLFKLRATITTGHVALFIAWRWHRASGRLPDRHRARSLGSLWMRRLQNSFRLCHQLPKANPIDDSSSRRLEADVSARPIAYPRSQVGFRCSAGPVEESYDGGDPRKGLSFLRNVALEADTD